MPEYIERDALERKYEERYLDYRNRSQRELFAGKILVDDTLTTAAVVMGSCLSSLREAPAADVAPVRHGRWMFGGDGIVECSVCNETYDVNMLPRNYCPNCGEKMDGGTQNEQS